MYEKLTLYVVFGESVGIGTAANGMFPLNPVGIAYGDGSGEGGVVNAPTGTLEPLPASSATVSVP